MIRRTILMISIGFIPSAALSADAGGTPLCGHIRLETLDRLSFTPLERKLVCGDPQDLPWATVPRNQARYMLGTFLQARGYYQYRFRDEPDSLVVATGATTLVSFVEGQGIPEEIDLSRYWIANHQALTPKVLDALEGWVRDQLRAHGYACPEVQTSANPQSGRVLVLVKPGARLNVTAVEEEPVPGLRAGVLRRYDAFEVGEVYDDQEVQLTARRTLGKQLLLSTHLSDRCEDGGVILHQKSLPGSPRLARVGFGFNTEQLFLIRGSLRNSRLGPTASILDVSLLLSYREQELTASSDWYVLPQSSRFYLRPEFDVRREYERQYESHSTRAAFAPAMTADFQRLGLSLSGWVGPSLLYVRTIGADSPEFSRIHSIDGQIDLHSHSHEYYAAAPRTGFQTNANWSIAIKQGSTVTAHRFGCLGEVLYNVAGWDPPFVVLGLRSGYAATITGGTQNEFEALPATYRRFLGGSQSVRGFARHSLPNNDGALTTFYAGAEARLVSIVPYDIQPLMFMDLGLTGREARLLDPPYYLSPGVGVRWQSPLGPLRLTVARGLVRGTEAQEHKGQEGTAVFFSFGEEF